MKTSSLEQLSNMFFDKHWNESTCGCRPVWNFDWNWSGSVPHHDKGGVYALFDKEGELVYVGLGIASAGNGLARRLTGHVIATNKLKGQGNYKPQSKWEHVTSIGCIGFPSDSEYLAAALELFIIQTVKPADNSSGTGKKAPVTVT